MRKLVWASLVLCLLSGMTRANEPVSTKLKFVRFLCDSGKAIQNWQGQALASLIHQGMTDKALVHLIGRGMKPLPTGGVNAAGCHMLRYYPQYGFTVLLTNFHDKTGELRVEKVTFHAPAE